MFLVGFRVQKKCNPKFHIFKRFDSDLEFSSVKIYFYKKYKGRYLKKFARLTDEHCGKK